jgi:hypothetical protein
MSLFKTWRVVVFNTPLAMRAPLRAAGLRTMARNVRRAKK